MPLLHPDSDADCVAGAMVHFMAVRPLAAELKELTSDRIISQANHSNTSADNVQPA